MESMIVGARQGVPFEVFTTIEDAYKCLDYWTEKLYLRDWVIKLKFVPFEEDPLNGENSGKVKRVFEQKAAIITLPRPDERFRKEREDFVGYVGHELSLVHELLHLKEDPIQFMDDGDYTAGYYNRVKHTEVEMMARTLIMVKYGLSPDYFNNVDRKEDNTMACGGGKKTKTPKKPKKNKK